MSEIENYIERKWGWKKRLTRSIICIFMANKHKLFQMVHAGIPYGHKILMKSPFIRFIFQRSCVFLYIYIYISLGSIITNNANTICLFDFIATIEKKIYTPMTKARYFNFNFHQSNIESDCVWALFFFQFVLSYQRNMSSFSLPEPGVTCKGHKNRSVIIKKSKQVQKESEKQY